MTKISTSPLQTILPGLQVWRSSLSGPQQPVNSYCLQTPRGLVVIDPATDLTPEIAGPAAAIFITHVQEEHIAGAANFPRAPLYVPRGDEYLCAGRDAYQNRDTTWQAPWDWETRGNYEGHLAGALNERPPQFALPVAGTLHASEAMFGLNILATPGHGKNALSFGIEIEHRKIIFCGDLIFERGKLWNWFDCDWDYGPQSGQKALLASARALLAERCDLLLPAHGAPIEEPQRALELLIARLETVLQEESFDLAPINFAEQDSPARGWRELSPRLHQWREGNCAALISQTGNALLIDDGLCCWQPEPERGDHHDAVMKDLKASLNLRHIEICIPTHYHGDHVENIPALAQNEGAQVICLDTVAQVIENPRAFNLSCTLPWYGAAHDTVQIQRRVASGTRLQWHEYELEIFHLGGQTYYHAGIGVVVDGARVLFVGDALFGWNLAPEPILCFNDCEPQTRGWAYAIERLIERTPDLLVCGHGSAIRDPQALLEAKRQRWQKRLQEYSALDARADRRRFFDPFSA